MKVFISWSGPRSKHIASALREWLPKVIQAVRPWMSDNDLVAGTRWSGEIAGNLQDCRIGIICVTPENLGAPWLNFEAGALSKTLTDSYVCPYLFELSPADLVGPLSQFQAKKADKEGTHQLIEMINAALPSALPKEEIDETFELRWPKLAGKLNDAPTVTRGTPSPRKDREILEEILTAVRGLTHRIEERPESITEEDQERRALSRLRFHLRRYEESRDPSIYRRISPALLTPNILAGLTEHHRDLLMELMQAWKRQLTKNTDAPST